MASRFVIRSNGLAARAGVRTAGVAVAAAAMGLGGCQSVPLAQYEQAIAENEELRLAVDAANARTAEAEADNEVLRLENDQLRAGAGRPAAADASGLSGLEGVDVTQRGGDVVVRVAGDVLFATGSASLRGPAKRTLDEIAREIRRSYPDAQIRVEGYTDTDPIRKSDWKTNERLSAERALAVEAYLVERGLDNDRVYAAAFGPAFPRQTKAQSRRVEIVVIGR